VRRVVVEHDVYIEVRRYVGVDLIEKLAKFDGAVTRVAFADHLPSQNVERREQCRRAMPFIVVRAALDLSRS
jgi:hypothetical protein